MDFFSRLSRFALGVACMLRYNAIRVTLAFVAFVATFALFVSTYASAQTPTIYLDYRYYSTTSRFGPHAVRVIPPNPFEVTSTVQEKATSLPGPDVSSIFSKPTGLDSSGKPKTRGVAVDTPPPLPTSPDVTKCVSTRTSAGPLGAAPTGPDLPLYNTVKANPQECTALYLYDAKMIAYESNLLAEVEKRAMDNVDLLLYLPAGGISRVATPYDTSDPVATAAFFTQYDDSTKRCVLNSAPTTTCTIESPLKSVACAGFGPAPDDSTKCQVGSPAAWEESGNYQAVRTIYGYLTSWQDVATNDFNAINPVLTSNPYAQDLKTGQSEINTALANTVNKQAVAAAQSGVFSTAPTFVYSYNGPDCRGMGWNGLEYTVTLSMTSNPANGGSTQTPSNTPPTNPNPSNPNPNRSSFLAEQLAFAPQDHKPGGGTGNGTQTTPGQTNTDKSSSSNSSTEQTVTIECPAPAFLVLGFAGDTVQNYTYTALAPNAAAGNTSKNAAIEYSAKPPRASISQLVTYQFSMNDAGSGFALSGGTSWPLNDAGPNWPFELVLGPSWVIDRGLVITAAAAYGSTNQLEPGYALHGPIKVGATVPTFAQNRPGFFLGIDFYRVPSSTKTSGPKSSSTTTDNTKK